MSGIFITDLYYTDVGTFWEDDNFVKNNLKYEFGTVILSKPCSLHDYITMITSMITSTIRTLRKRDWVLILITQY